jgi:serine/threonine protein kinase
VNLTPDLLIADRFRLVSPLGQGGMGAVWLAHHTGLNIPCAVKFIHPEAAEDPEIRARFEREARAVAQIRSPNVIQIFDHGIWQGVPYIAMEYLQGEDLARRLKHRRTITPAETYAILAQISHALAKAHAAGIVHRDLKPANIFLVRDDDQEIAKVLDFGVAKDIKPGLDMNTQTGATLGTPFYMSPEQGRGLKNLDHRSDLWALGVIAYQCLTGRLPFNGEVLGDLLMKIMVDPIPLPSAIASLPRGFDAWWLRAVARDPAQRFQSTRELIEALRQALEINQPGQGISDQNRTSFSSEAQARSAANWPPPAPDQAGSAHLAVAPMPTPLQHAITAQQPARPSRAVASIAAAMGVLALGAGAAFFALRSGSAAPTAAAPEATVAPAPAQTTTSSALVAPVEIATVAPVITPSASAPPPLPTAAPVEAKSAAVEAKKAPPARPTAAAPTKPAVPPPPAKKKHEGIF